MNAVLRGCVLGQPIVLAQPASGTSLQIRRAFQKFSFSNCVLFLGTSNSGISGNKQCISVLFRDFSVLKALGKMDNDDFTFKFNRLEILRGTESVSERSESYSLVSFGFAGKHPGRRLRFEMKSSQSANYHRYSAEMDVSPSTARVKRIWSAIRLYNREGPKASL